MAFGTARRGRPAPGAPRPRKHVWLRLVLILIIVILVVAVVPTPWAVHIGGRFTPLEEWGGYGQVKASNGGRYVLFTTFHGGILQSGHNAGCSFNGGCNSLIGTAQLCTESGHTYTFTLTGSVDSWLSTDNAATRVDLTGGSPVRLPSGWVVALHGKWHGPALVLASPDNSFTEVFTPRGAIRTTTSTADAGTATVTVRYGSAGDFTKACHALASAS